MRVLYVNQTGRVSGGERSLLTLGDLGRVEPLVACPDGDSPTRGPGVPRFPLPDRGGLRLHPVHTPRPCSTSPGSAEVRAAAASHQPTWSTPTRRAGLLVSPPGARRLAHVRDCRRQGAAPSLSCGRRPTRRRCPPSPSTPAASARRPVRVVHDPVDLAASPGRPGRGAIGRSTCPRHRCVPSSPRSPLERPGRRDPALASLGGRAPTHPVPDRLGEVRRRRHPLRQPRLPRPARTAGGPARRGRGALPR